MTKLQQVCLKKEKGDEVRYFITIPKNLVEQKGWKKGQNLFFLFNERGNIEITEELR